MSETLVKFKIVEVLDVDLKSWVIVIHAGACLCAISALTAGLGLALLGVGEFQVALPSLGMAAIFFWGWRWVRRKADAILYRLEHLKGVPSTEVGDDV